MQIQRMVRVVAKATLVTALVISGWAVAQSSGTLLTPAEVEKQFPATVYYNGQTAPAQIRNSGGIKFPDGHYVLISLVDTSGYSSGVAAKYQGYLIAEIPIRFGDKRLPAGAYGIGFLAGNKFLVTDLGGSDVLTVQTATDSTMIRPRPLEVTMDSGGGFRIYSGRSYVQISR